MRMRLVFTPTVDDQHPTGRHPHGDSVSSLISWLGEYITSRPHGALSPFTVTLSWLDCVLIPCFCSYYTAAKLPLWITEVGTNDMSVQAQFPQNTFSALYANESVIHTEAVFWFCWSDGMVSPFGVVDSSGNPKPSYASYQSWAKQW